MPSLAALLDTQRLAPHGVGLLWRPELIWLHVGSDAATGLAYWSILIVLALLVRRRRDLMFPSMSPWAVDLFALFILACGATHFVAIWTLWQPDYGLQGVIKAITAALSVATAVVLWPLMPRILALPSAAALQASNARLSHEVAERREAERRAHDSEARFTGFFEHLSDALFVVRAEPTGLVFETVNSSFCQLFRQPREAIEGHGPDRLLEPQARQALIAEFAACLAAGRPRDWENVTSDPPSSTQGPSPQQRSTTHLRTVLVPLPAAPDGIPRLLGSLRDVTELRRLQAEAAETAQRAIIGAMCAGVAHEMSQPVNIIGLWTERALEPTAPQSRRTMEVVLGQTRRLGVLLTRMRDLVRNEPSAFEVFDAAVLAGAVAEAARRDWAPDALAVQFVPPEHDGAAPVRGRPAQLEQALRGILENARDAMLDRRRRDPAAPGQLTIRVTADAARQQVGIAIRDTGGGVPVAVAARLMEPFVTTKDPGAGTGLGLAIAAGICRGMGGRLSWMNHPGTHHANDPHPGPGAEFRLDLPRAGAVLERAA